MLQRLWIVSMIVGCGATAADVERAREQSTTENQARIDAKLSEIARTRALSGMTLMSEGDTPAAVRLAPGGDLVPVDQLTGQLRIASIVELEDGTLLYAVPSNCSGCNCVIDGVYRLAQGRDGKAAVIHLSYRIKTKTMKVSGRCGFGCGAAQAPQPPAFWTLPVHDRTKIEVIEDVVDRVVIVKQCDTMIPAP
jgi:hypothetical protein